MKRLFYFYYLIDSKYKFASLAVIMSLFLNAIFEVLAIGSLYSFITFIVDPEYSFETYSEKKLFYILKLFYNSDTIILDFLLLISSVFIIKFLFNILTIFIQNKFSYSLLQNISYKLFSHYISSNLKKISISNSSYLIRNLTTNLNIFVNGINAIINILTEVLVVLSILFLLLLVDFKTTIVILVFFTSMCSIFLLIIKIRIKKLSEERYNYEGKKIKSINESINGLIDIKLNGKISFFKDIYFKTEKILNNNYTKLHFIYGLPKIWIELITVGTFIFLIFLIDNRSNIIIDNYLPLIGIYAFSVFKLMPSFNKILTNYTAAKFSFKIFDEIFFELKNIKKLKKEVLLNENKKIYKINIKNLMFYYKKPKKIFKNLNLEFVKGKSYGITGVSGVGKSTLINLLIGIISPTKGSISYNQGIKISNNLTNWHNKISYVQQKPYFFDESILKNIALGCKPKDIDKQMIYKCLKIVNLSKKINNLSNNINSRIGDVLKKFSGGELQRIAIARALYNNKDILILDEATSALDDKNEEKILNRLKKIFFDKIIIIISHKQKIINSCDVKINL